MGTKVEYYLSCYISPPGAMSVLNFRHDQNIALWRHSGNSVDLVRVWELERISGQKRHYWPLFTRERVESLLEDLLAEEDLGLADISMSWGTREIPKAAELLGPEGSEQFPMHAICHVYSGLMMDRNIYETDTIIALAVDGGPDFELDTEDKKYWYAGCVSERGRLQFAPIQSPAPLYAAGRVLFGQEPGTLMALASACETEMDFDVEAAVGRLKLTGDRYPPYIALPFVQSIVDEAESQLASCELDSRFTRTEHLQSAVMSVVQRCSELIMVRNIESLCTRFGVEPSDAYLSISGGFGLNCPTNTYLLDRFNFKGLLTPPCANDAGQALGIGLLGLHNLGLLDRSGFRLNSAYYGCELNDVDKSIDHYAEWISEVSDFSPEQLIKDIVEMPIAWVAGAAELGPRALGHRSLLGDPRSPETKALLNRVKGRQWWRPVAPLVLEDRAADWFVQNRPSPFMLEAVQVKPARRGRVPAILHLDGSARHQTLERAVNPLLYDALAAFDREVGVPIFCNTSLNDKGEPIVNSAREALNFCIRKGIRVAYLDGRRVELRASALDLIPPDGPAVRSSALFSDDAQAREQAWHEWRDRDFSDEDLPLRVRSPWLDKEAQFSLHGMTMVKDPSLAWMSGQ